MPSGWSTAGHDLAVCPQRRGAEIDVAGFRKLCLQHGIAFGGAVVPLVEQDKPESLTVAAVSSRFTHLGEGQRPSLVGQLVAQVLLAQ
jgi:hypothetical protein